MACIGRGGSAEHRSAGSLSPGSADVGPFLGFPLFRPPSVAQKLIGASAWVPKSPASDVSLAGDFRGAKNCRASVSLLCKTTLRTGTGVSGSPCGQGVRGARALICTHLLIAMLGFLTPPHQFLLSTKSFCSPISDLMKPISGAAGGREGLGSAAGVGAVGEGSLASQELKWGAR